MRRIIVLGSTGSIGTQALDVDPRQPAAVRGRRPRGRHRTREMLARAGRSSSASSTPRSAPSRPSSWCATSRPTSCSTASPARSASAPTLAALEGGRTLALANKESLIVGGELVIARAAPGQIVPVDSEHSAIAQALRSGTHAEVRRLVLTASGGPFRGRTRDELADVTPRRGARAPDLGHGPRGHDELRDAREQGPRGHRGASAVRRRLRRHRRRRAPAVDRALDGRVHRRLDDRAGVAARHAPADLARPRTGRTASAASGVRSTGPTATSAGRSSRSTTRRSPSVALAKSVGPRRRHLPRGLQRGERAGGRRVPRGAAVVPRHRRHDRAGRRRA